MNVHSSAGGSRLAPPSLQLCHHLPLEGASSLRSLTEDAGYTSVAARMGPRSGRAPGKVKSGG